MEKIVSPGERVTTFTLDGTECAVKFASKYRVFCVKSDSDVTVSLASGKSAGDDGVMVCKAGESIMYPHMRQLDTVYITGSGNVTVYAGNEAVNPFKGDAKGGETSGCIFSTDEQVAGTWIDGRAIYKKTIIFNALNQSTSKTSTTKYNHNIENIDIIWFSGDSFWITKDLYKVMAFQIGMSDELTPVYSHVFNCSINATQITIITGPSLGDIIVYATVMYVKNN